MKTLLLVAILMISFVGCNDTKRWEGARDKVDVDLTQRRK